MAKLDSKERKALPTSDFAGPGRSYPIDTRARGANAKARAAQFASPSEKAKIDAKVDKKFPGMGKSDDKKDGPMGKMVRGAMGKK